MKSTINTRLNDMRPALETLAESNKMVSRLMNDSPRYLRARKPMTNEELLGAQVGTVLTTKQRIASTLEYIAFKGGGARQTASFGGVFAIRNSLSHQEKRAVFSVYHDMVSTVAATPDSIMQHVSDVIDPLAAHNMGLGVSAAGNQLSVLAYLGQQLPRSQDPRHQPDDFSMMEVDGFLELVGALVDPITYLATAKDNSIMQGGIDAIRTAYPDLYTEMALDVGEFVAEYAHMLDDAALHGLDAFTGYALGFSEFPSTLMFQRPTPQTVGQSASLGPQSRQMEIRIGTTPAQKVGSM